MSDIRKVLQCSSHVDKGERNRLQWNQKRQCLIDDGEKTMKLPPPQRLRKKGRGKKDATNFFNKNKCYIMMEIIQATAFSVQNLATQKKKEVGTAKNQQASNQPFIF